MKQITLLFAIIISALATLAQVPASPKSEPQGIIYQTVIRDSEGIILPNKEISMQMTIRTGMPDGEVVYQEIHDDTTSAFGLVDLIIGYGVPVVNTFADINWGDGDKYLETAIDIDGGSNFTVMGVTQFFSVPYALYSQKAENIADGETPGEMLYWDGAEWNSVEPGEHNQTLRLCNGVPTWGECKYNLTVLAGPQEAGNVEGEGKYFENEDITITATANPGWVFINWIHADTVISDSASFVFNMPAKYDTLIANFSDITYSLNLEANPTEAGTVSGVGQYPEGDQVAVSAFANQGWDFTHWTDVNGVVSSDASFTYTMPAMEVTLTANFITHQLVIGDEHQGGIIAYILQPGDPGYINGEVNGLIAAATDLSPAAAWGCEGIEITGADGTALGTGYQNTLDIVAGCSETGIAARICHDLELNGYADWYLPSKEELYKLYLYQGFIGGFHPDEYYWSSSEGSPWAAWSQKFEYGSPNMGHISKNSNYRVRAVRSFSSFNCGDVFVDSRDGQSYETVQIGDQCWMAENLNIGSQIDGSEEMTDNGTIEKYCFNNDPANCETYGGLYQWDEIMNYTTTEGVQGICPEGWHLPTDADWCILEQVVDSTITCNSTGNRGVDGGGKLKETGTLHWECDNTGATNSSGFTALPGGWRSFGNFVNMNWEGSWWSSSEYDNTNAWHRGLFCDNAQVVRHNDQKIFGRSVRCLRD
jgi:uncharacterized protein (TIGR02145 family)